MGVEFVMPDTISISSTNLSFNPSSGDILEDSDGDVYFKTDYTIDSIPSSGIIPVEINIDGTIYNYNANLISSAISSVDSNAGDGLHERNEIVDVVGPPPELFLSFGSGISIGDQADVILVLIDSTSISTGSSANLSSPNLSFNTAQTTVQESSDGTKYISSILTVDSLPNGTDPIILTITIGSVSFSFNFLRNIPAPSIANYHDRAGIGLVVKRQVIVVPGEIGVLSVGSQVNVGDVGELFLFTAHNNNFFDGIGDVITPDNPDPATSVTAKITGEIGTKTGNFRLAVTFNEDVSDFTDDYISVLPIIPGSSFSVSGIGRNWIISFTMPSNIAETEITVSISEILTVIVGSQSLNIHSASVTITYDSTSDIVAIFREPEYNLINELLEIKTQIDFITSEDDHSEILGLEKTDFHLLRVEGDDINDFNYWITGEDLTYFLHIVPEKDRSGIFQVDLTGHVFKMDGVTNEIVLINPIDIPYGTEIPNIINYDIPASVTKGIWDVYIEFNVFVTELGVDKFIYEGIDLFQPSIYRISNNNLDYKGFSATDRASIVESEAFDLTLVPINSSPDGDHFANNVGDWIKLPDQLGNTIPSKFFLLRYFVYEEHLLEGISFNLTLPPRSVRGPDGS